MFSQNQFKIFVFIGEPGENYQGTELNGNRGVPGDPGPEGAKGSNGPAGDPGRKGAPGEAGAPGIDGEDGLDAEPVFVNIDNSISGLTFTAHNQQ